MGHCKDCKWWDNGEKEDSYYWEVRVQFRRGRGLCLKAVPTWEDERDESPIVTMDCSQCLALLFTKPDFGCVLFEEETLKPHGEQNNTTLL